MLLSMDDKDARLRQCQRRIDRAEKPTADVLLDTERTLALTRQATAQDRRPIVGLVDEAAWLDAALTLLAQEAPQWSLRRLVLDDGIWLCSLSKQPRMPIEFDDTIDATHPCLSLAVLSAAVGAVTRCRIDPADESPASRPSAPACQPATVPLHFPEATKR